MALFKSQIRGRYRDFETFHFHFSLFGATLSLQSMEKYSSIVDPVFNDRELLRKLRPTGVSDINRLLKIRAASDEELAGGAAIADPEMFRLVRAGLIYACDGLDESHKIVQQNNGDEAAYWHGMIRRREGDFENARYWYRRAGALPFFGEVHRAASAVSGIVAAQLDWDPYLVTGMCEQERFGAEEERTQLIKIQRAEFENVFDYVWRRSFKTGSPA